MGIKVTLPQAAPGITSAIADEGQTAYEESNIDGGWRQIFGAAVTVTVEAGQHVLIIFSHVVEHASDAAYSQFELRRNAASIAATRYRCYVYDYDDEDNHARQYLDTPGAGNFTYSVWAGASADGTDVDYGILTVIVFN